MQILGSFVETDDQLQFYIYCVSKYLNMFQDLTNYEGWLNEPSGSEMAPLFDVIWKDPWEPFFIASNNVPLYDERFKQYGFNRISQVQTHHL